MPTVSFLQSVGPPSGLVVELRVNYWSLILARWAQLESQVLGFILVLI